MSELTPQEMSRYGRHLSLPEIGAEGQERLKKTSVLVIGLGGLGSPLALYLAAAGIGKMTLVEFDSVDDSNLQRQVLFKTKDVGRQKITIAAESLRALNPFIEIDCVPERFSIANAERLVASHDIIADGADNFATRFLVNDACVLSGKPLVSASLLGFEGQLAIYNFRGGPCYRCLYPEPPPAGLVPSCAEGGVLGALCGVMGSLQAVEVVKVALGQGSMNEHLLQIDAWAMQIEKFRIRKNPDCTVCGPKPTIRSLSESVALCGITEIREIAAVELKKRLRDFFVLDVREADEVAKSKIDGSHWIPLGALLTRIQEVPNDKEIVVYCRAGGRSRQAAELLTIANRRVLNLTDGAKAWARDVDPTFIVG